MDGYLAKPVKPDVLHREIERVMGGIPAGAALATKGAADMTEQDEPIFDRADALSRIADDEELLATLIELFLEDAPRYLRDVDAALAASDWTKLGHAAHTLKGVLATFSARRGEHLARDLELAARSEQQAVCAELVPRMHREFEAFLKVVR